MRWHHVVSVLLLGGCGLILVGCINSMDNARKAKEAEAAARKDTHPPEDRRDAPPPPEPELTEEEKAKVKAVLAVNPLSFREARQAHRTKLLEPGPSPQSYGDEVPEGVTRVAYESGGRKLFAWLAQPEGTGPFPAVLYAHGGFALGKGDVRDIRPFLDAGYVVLLPAWRGENGNPGDFEMCYGEVDDALAALEYLGTVPGVDGGRLYAAGHSAGGTIVMLLAELSPRLRRAAACGGLTDMHFWVTAKNSPAYPNTPFDWKDPTESDLRSPRRYLKDLSCPLRLYYGEKEAIETLSAELMRLEADKRGKAVKVEVIPGADHGSALAPSIERMIAFFRVP